MFRFTNITSKKIVHTIERVMRDLKKTMNLTFYNQKFMVILEGYCDGNWNTLSNNSKSNGGVIYLSHIEE